MAAKLTNTTAGGPVATWRQFSFFETTEVTDAEDLGSSPAVFRSLIPPYCITSPSKTGPLSETVSCIISESNGYISLLDTKFQTIKRWKGWESQSASTSTGSQEGDGQAGKGKGKTRERGVMLLECGGVLLGIGEDDAPSHFPILKIWDLLHDDNKTKQPVLMRSVRLGTGGRGYPVSTIASTANLSYLAIGLVSGQVLLYRHVSESLTTSPQAISSFPKARIVWEGSLAEPITGLGFRDPLSPLYEEVDTEENGGAGTGKGKQKEREGKIVTSLFITTTSKTIAIPSVTGRGTDPRILEESDGAGLGCAVMDGKERDLIVGRDEGIYLYGLEGRGAVLAYEGPKSSIFNLGKSLVIVSPPFTSSANSNSATVRRSAAITSDVASSSSAASAKVTVFDLVNKFVSYSGVHRHGIQHVLATMASSSDTSSSPMDIHLLLGDGNLVRLSEISTEAKIEALYRKNLYTLAGGVARSEGMDEQGIKEIWARYGDYLYTKGDFEAAIGQFVKTLGYLQPSHVIRKFLDAQRIQNLITYLQELHAKGMATPDHTTLLLNCYTKTSDAARLDAFLKTETSRDGELPFDLETAIRVCRQAGFYEHATYLAKRYRQDQEYLMIMLEDVRDYQAALDYLSMLEPKTAERNLLRYGRTLLQNRPEETTTVLIDLCSGNFLSKQKELATRRADKKHTGPASDSQASQAPNYLSYLGYDKVTGVFGSSTAAPPANAADTATVPPAAPVDGTPTASPQTVSAPVAEPPTTAYPIPSPRQYFAHFISSPTHFLRFLESVASDRWQQTVSSIPDTAKGAVIRTVEAPIDQGSPTNALDADDADQRCVWNTLLELYLTDAQDQQSSSSTSSRQKALNVVQRTGDLPVDPMHALMVCSTAGFTPGQIRLWEKLGMYEEVLRFWMNVKPGEAEPKIPGEERSASGNVLHYLHLYGPTNPQLYPLVLRYLTADSARVSQHAKDVRDILNVIDDENLMPPLAVVQLLSRNTVTSIGVVKDWLRAKVADTRQDVESDQILVKSYRSETEEKLKEIASLADADHPQVFQVTRCASCGGQLDLPTVHYMCKHSYHQRCLPDSDTECPSCARQYAVIRELRRHQQELADRHDLFLAEVADADDGFAVIAGAFGRGLLNKPVHS